MTAPTVSKVDDAKSRMRKLSHTADPYHQRSSVVLEEDLVGRAPGVTSSVFTILKFCILLSAANRPDALRLQTRSQPVWHIVLTIIAIGAEFHPANIDLKHALPRKSSLTLPFSEKVPRFSWTAGNKNSR